MTSGATGTTGTPPTADKEDFTLIDINIILSMFLRMMIWKFHNGTPLTADMEDFTF